MWSCGGNGPVSKIAARPTDNECSSVGRTQLSDTDVGDELTIVGQVTRGVAGQGPVDESRYLGHDALPPPLYDAERDFITTAKLLVILSRHSILIRCVTLQMH